MDKDLEKHINSTVEARLRELRIKTVNCYECGEQIFWLTTEDCKRTAVGMDLKHHFPDGSTSGCSKNNN